MIRLLHDNPSIRPEQDQTFDLWRFSFFRFFNRIHQYQGHINIFCEWNLEFERTCLLKLLSLQHSTIIVLCFIYLMFHKEATIPHTSSIFERLLSRYSSKI